VYPFVVIGLVVWGLAGWTGQIQAEGVKKSPDGGVEKVPRAAVPPAGIAPTKVFLSGHSFHMFLGGLLPQVTKLAGIDANPISGSQGIGGSQVKQHWDLAEDKNTLRKAILAGEVDVLTVAPNIWLPDEGIDKFAELLVEHNPHSRMYVQASWFPYDKPELRGKLKNEERDDFAIDDLRKAQAPFFEAINDQARKLNEKLAPKAGHQVVYVTPVGQAVLALREKVVAGQVPGVTKQSELFTDSIGHCRAHVQLLCAYVTYASIYGKSPVGLGVPPAARALSKEPDEAQRVNALLQQIAWDAVTSEPLTGVKK
jgi:hypothetical protein